MHVCMNDMNTVVLKFLPMPEGSKSRRSQQLKQNQKQRH